MPSVTSSRVTYDRRPRAPARALLVIDQPVLTDAVKRALNHGHYATRVTSTVDDAAAVLAEWQPHLIICDLEAEGSGILDRLAKVSRDGAAPPLIALTTSGDLNAKLAAFDRGADDILTVPFCPEEFVARVGAVMRRAYREALVFTPVLRIGDLEIDILNRHVCVGPTPLRLTSLEQSLLYLLAANAGRLLTRDEILDYLWGADYVAESNVVDRHIRNLRVKLHDQSAHEYIATVPRRGYRFVVPTVAMR